MSEQPATDSQIQQRVLTVIPDANVLVHGRALSDLPWEEIGRSEIEVLLVPPVIRELDKLKNQSGRPNKIARQLSSDVRSLRSAPDCRAVIRKSSPVVTKRLELRTISVSFHPSLRLDHADQSLINYALHLRASGSDVLLLTDDTICCVTAEEVGLPVQLMHESWLRDPESDESAKENARLKAEIKRLTAAEPRIELGFRDENDQPTEVLEARLTRWPALDEAEIGELMSEVERVCPSAHSFERPAPRATDSVFAAAERLSRIGRLGSLQPRPVYEPATTEEIELYKTKEYPEWLESIRAKLRNLHEELQSRTAWPRLSATASNIGTRPASHVLLQVRTQGALSILNVEADDDVDDNGDESNAISPLALPLPPAPPRGRVKTIDPLGFSRNFGHHGWGVARPMPLDIPHLRPPEPRRSDAFYWRSGRRDEVSLMELECESWRHGHEGIDIVMEVRADELTDTAGAVELTTNAANVSDPPSSRLPVRITFEDGPTIERARALIEQLGRHARSKGRL